MNIHKHTHTLTLCAGNTNARLEFDTKSGVLVARRDGTLITLDFPANPPQPLDPAEEAQLAGLLKVASGGLPVSQVLLSRTSKKLLVRLRQSCSRCVEYISPLNVTIKSIIPYIKFNYVKFQF